MKKTNKWLDFRKDFTTKDLILISILVFSYLFLWVPASYVVAKFWVEMIASGFDLENDFLDVWKYAAIPFIMILLIIVPPTHLYMKIKYDK